MKKMYLIFSLIFFLSSCEEKYDPIVAIYPSDDETVALYKQRSELIFESIYNHYWSNKVNLFMGSYPNLINTPQEATTPKHGVHAYLWGHGAVFSAYNMILQHTANYDEFKAKYEDKMKVSLDQYYAATRNPQGYACFVFDSDERLYDDAIWVGIDLVELYDKTQDDWYLDRAKKVWSFIMTGKDNALGGGIYWGEDGTNRETKNTCSNAPAVVLALKLYETTKDETYLNTGKEIYEWVKSKLKDTDNLYWDSIKLDGTISTTKFSYNSGQMLQAGVLLYNATQEAKYMDEAKAVAEASYNYFFEIFKPNIGEDFKIIKDGHVWFNAIMVRGFVELYQTDKNDKYVSSIKQTLNYAWSNSFNDETGLMKANFSGKSFSDDNTAGDILTQGAIAEMYARLAIK